MKSKLTRRDLIKSSIAITTVSSTGLKASERTTKNPFKNKTLQMLVQTIVPGGKEGPTGAPGAMEAETVKYLWRVERDKLLPVPFGVFGNLITCSLNTASFFMYRRKFSSLTLKKREVVAKKVESLPGVHLFYKVIRAPFYTAAVNNVGYDYFGYPGANQGYPNFSFKEKLSQPHPRSLNGNLP